MGAGLLIAAGAGILALGIRSALRDDGSAVSEEPGSDEASMDNGDLPWSLSLTQFRACLPSLSATRSAQLYEPFLAACYEVPIATQAQLAAFIAQLSHESLDFRAFEEYASGTAYEGRADLGNTEPGDGPRYKGRGAIMVTGRANYREAGRVLGVDLELAPELAATDTYAFRVAAWYWRKRNLNALVDARNFVGLTRAINGGTNGLADRQTRLVRTCRVLGIVTAWA